MSEDQFNLNEEDVNFKSNFNLFTQGSEAKVYFGKFLSKDAVLKERFIKKYRHPELDKILSLERMKAEVRALNRCIDIGIKCPNIYFCDLETRCIVLERISDCITVKDLLKSQFEKEGIESISSLIPLAQKIGTGIAAMHKSGLVHGDLTTSNLLLQKCDRDNLFNKSDFNVYFIDFGLSKRDIIVEDKAVDLYVLERAVSSSHPNSQQFYDSIIESYLKTLGKEEADIVEGKLNEVRLRGRKRTMVG